MLDDGCGFDVVTDTQHESPFNLVFICQVMLRKLRSTFNFLEAPKSTKQELRGERDTPPIFSTIISVQSSTV